MLSLRLAFANMKKKKGTSIILVIFILIATACFNIGVKVQDKCKNLVKEKTEAMGAPDFIAACDAKNYEKKFEKYLQEDTRVKTVEKEDVLYMPTSKNNKNTLELGALIFNCDANREIAPFHLVEEDTSIAKDQAIYLPMILKGYDVKLGDDYNLVCKGNEYKFKVAGFFETVYYGTSTAGNFKYFISDEIYQEMYSKVGRATILSVQLHGTYHEKQRIMKDFVKDFKAETNFSSSMTTTFLGFLDTNDMEDSCIGILTIIAAMLIAFAMALCMVILVVIINRVIEHIEENMQNIGVLQAIGYTSRHIISSIVYEFGMIALVACSLGTGISYMILPTLKGVFTKASGLVLHYSWNLKLDLLGFVVIIGAILLVAEIAALKVLKFPPVKALNKGIKAHLFKKNLCPLYKGFGNVHFRIALKNVFSNKKQNIMYSMIIACSMFIIGLVLTIYINFSSDRTMLYQMLGMELSDVQVRVTKQTDIDAFSKELCDMEEVRKTNLSDIMIVNVDDVEAQAIISDNFTAMEVLHTYEGNMPKYKNEIVITGVVAKAIKKEIGDTVSVSAEGRTKEFYVVGIYQSTNENGYMTILPYEGAVELRPQYKMRQIDVYLNEGQNKEAFKEKLRTQYKVAVKEDENSYEIEDGTTDAMYSDAEKKAEERIAKLLADYGIDSLSYTVMQDGKVILAGDSFDYKIDDLGDYIEFGGGQLDTYSSLIVGIVGVVTIIILVIIAGILSITIKSMLRKKREEYGIYKALGYTTKEIVRQISINYALAALIGVIVGGIIVVFGTNYILSFFFSSMGLTHLIFAVPYSVIVILAILLMLFTYTIAIIKAYQVRKITTYDLLIE